LRICCQLYQWPVSSSISAAKYAEALCNNVHVITTIRDLFVCLYFILLFNFSAYQQWRHPQ
jgi:hypothetical protein